MIAHEADLCMEDIVNELIFFLVWTLPESGMGILCIRLVGVLPYTRYTLRDGIIPLVRS